MIPERDGLDADGKVGEIAMASDEAARPAGSRTTRNTGTGHFRLALVAGLAALWQAGSVVAQALSCAQSYSINTSAGTGTIRRLLASPYTDASGTSVLFGTPALASVVSLGVNPVDLNKIYYFPPSGTRTLYYVDLTAAPSTAGNPAAPAFTVPAGASDTLAFGPTGQAHAYDYTAATLYRQGSAPLAFGVLQGGGPGNDPKQYVVNDIVVDSAGLVYAIGLFPAGAPTSAHLIRFDPARGRAEYVRAINLSPVPPTFPTSSSGLAFAPGSSDSAPMLLWTPSTGIYTVNVLTGTATRNSATSRADLASCPSTAMARRILLDKTWVGAAGSESVTLSIGPGAGLIAPASGSASAGGPAVAAQAGALAASPVLLGETFVTGNAAEFTSTLSCVKTSDGSTLPLSANTVTVPADSDVQCRFENRKRPYLTLDKQVLDLPGASSPPASSWILQANGGALGVISGSSGDAAVINVLAREGSYALSESGGVAGYAPGAWTCIGTAGLGGATVNLAAGDVATCRVTNTRITGSLSLSTTISGAPPGQPWQYTLAATGANVASCLPTPLTASVPAGGGSTVMAPLPSHATDGSPCSYTLNQVPQPGWVIDAAASSALTNLGVPAGGGAISVQITNRPAPVAATPQAIPSLPAWPLAAALLTWFGMARLRRGALRR
jgi:hypothetical protein